MSDVIIVNPQKLREAISEFESCKSQISNDISSLESNIGEIRSAWKDEQASNTYQSKMQKLVTNVTAARDKLQQNIQDLESYTGEVEKTISEAQAKSESLDSNFMV